MPNLDDVMANLARTVGLEGCSNGLWIVCGACGAASKFYANEQDRELKLFLTAHAHTSLPQKQPYRKEDGIHSHSTFLPCGRGNK